jgi:hypothetical protein
MTEETNELIASLNINKILIAILEELGEVRIPTLKFLDSKTQDQELVIDYEEDPATFIFKLRGINE